MILFEKKYQTFDTVFHHQMKHLEVRQKYSAARRIFNSLLGVSSGDETLHLMFDILLRKWFIKRWGVGHRGGASLYELCWVFSPERIKQPIQHEFIGYGSTSWLFIENLRWFDPVFYLNKSICIVKRLWHMDYTLSKLYYGVIFWEFGINATWQWRHNGFSSKSNFSPVRHFTLKCYVFFG